MCWGVTVQALHQYNHLTPPPPLPDRGLIYSRMWMWFLCIVARVCENLFNCFHVIYFPINLLFPHTLGIHSNGWWKLRLTHLCCCFVTQFSEFNNLYLLYSVLFSNHKRKRNINIKWQHHAERKPLEWPPMTPLELKDYVLYPLYVTVSPHRRTTQHCRGLSNLIIGGGVGIFTPEDPSRLLFQRIRPTIKIVKSTVSNECA